jgi:predicted ribosome quality control (RQC) complex YloA/Tae2 family protein
MLSYRELKRAVVILQSRLPGSILHRAAQTEDLKIRMAFRAADEEVVVLLACRPEFARLSSAPEAPWTAVESLSFGQYLKAHLQRARFGSISLAEQDRQAALRLETPEGPFDIIFSILGARSNVYLLNPEGRLVHALRPLEDTRRELELGGPWSSPAGMLRSEGTDRWESVADDDYLQAIERDYQVLERARQIETLARRIENAVAREEAFLDRKSANLQEDLGDARQAEEYKRKGELLKGMLHLIRAGDQSVTVRDFATNEPVTITLDPRLTPAQNLETYFRRYQKEQRGIAAILEQIDTLRSSRSALEAIREELRRIIPQITSGLGELERLAAEPRVRRLLARHYPSRRASAPAKPPAAKREIPGRLAPKRYRTAEGLEVWVGKSDEGNDYLTTRLSRGNDLFFHLNGFPGSHVVLRTEGRTDPPSESMLAACELAVHFSKMKNATRADVHVAYVKDIKKPKGVKRGLVYVSRGKTIHLRRDPRRLEEILSSRLDE